MRFRRAPAPDPPLTNDNVTELFGALADIYATTLDIRNILLGDDDEEEEANS